MIIPQPGGTIYRQLAAILRGDIISGRLHPGQVLPSERTMMQQHGVSRDTTRRATALLRAEGLVVVRRGHGLTVKEIPPRTRLDPPAGSVVTSRMPTEDEAAELSIGEGVPVFWVIA